MFIGHVTGYLGSDAKKTQKGYSFNVSTKYKEGNEEKTLWICCFLNYETKVAEFLKQELWFMCMGKSLSVSLSVILVIQSLQ